MANRSTFYSLLLTLILIPVLSNAKDSEDISNDAIDIIRKAIGSADKSIPEWLLDRAQAIVILPDYQSDGKENQAIFSVRTSNGTWSQPSMAKSKISGPDQNKKNQDAVVLLFMKGNGNDDLRKGNAIISGNGIESGPGGNLDKSDFDGPDNNVVFAYSINGNNEATGADFDQIGIQSDSDANKDLYKKDVSLDQILNYKVTDPPEKATELQAILNGLSIGKGK